ncbi:MAG: peptide chain release factor N(5)-glutamine methyltransferase [Desulfobacterales bacterium]|nr:peptide chain release factor N(5)-glutamine methyltransferase [Desulfobacterales bacterium]
MQNQGKIGESQWTILKLLKWTASYFTSYRIESPRVSAEILLAHTLNLQRIQLYLNHDQPLIPAELDRFKALIKRRVCGEPIAYILGRKEFWSIELEVTRDVLIPRPETERLVEAAVRHLPQSPGIGPKRVLDMGTGSGAIVLALASERPGHTYFASDRSISALELAKRNARRNGLDRAVHFFSGDWFLPVKRQGRPFDMIISNPPYIPTEIIPGLQPEICRYEPFMALDGGADGLCWIRHIVDAAQRHLNSDGLVLLEMGHDQKEEVEKIILTCGGYKQVDFKKDYGEKYRIVQMVKK